MLAHGADPDRAGMSESGDSESAPLVECANCGALKAGPFCAACGQNDRNYLRSILLVVGDFLGETFEINSRLSVTLAALFFRPGFLSAEFSRNRRARYLSPFRLYLFASLLFFFVLSLTVDLPRPLRPGLMPGEAPAAGDEAAPVRVERGVGRLRVGIDEERGADAVLIAGDDSAADAEAAAAISALKAEIDGPQQRMADDIMERPSVSRRILVNAAKGVFDPARPRAIDDFDRYMLGQAVEVLHRPWAVADRFMEYLPVAMFFILPLYALLLKILYIRHRRFYSEHLIFGMHIHTVAFVGFTAAAALSALLPETAMEWTRRALVCVLLVYYYLALKRFYANGWRMTGFKFLLLLWFYCGLLAVVMLTAFVAVLLLF